ncbi:MAG: caspase family protein, partial [Pseudomonadales bacterium]
MTSKSISILFIIVTIIGIATTAVANTRGISVQVRASEAINAPVLENVDLYQQSYALVIGIDEYTNGWPRLSNAVKDARLVAKALEEKNFSVDLHENLTSAELAQVFKRFFILKGEQPEARLFVWYAGHGATVD